MIREDNAARLRTRLVVSGANIPTTPGAERWLHEHGIVNVPDFIANAGGVMLQKMPGVPPRLAADPVTEGQALLTAADLLADAEEFEAEQFVAETHELEHPKPELPAVGWLNGHGDDDDA